MRAWLDESQKNFHHHYSDYTAKNFVSAVWPWQHTYVTFQMIIQNKISVIRSQTHYIKEHRPFLILCELNSYLHSKKFSLSILPSK